MPLVSVGPLPWDIIHLTSPTEVVSENNDANGMSRYPHEKVIEEQGEKNQDRQRHSESYLQLYTTIIH